MKFIAEKSSKEPTSADSDHQSYRLADHNNKNLTTFLFDCIKYDVVVILVFFPELFDGYSTQGSLRKIYCSLLRDVMTSRFPKGISLEIITHSDH